MKTKLILTGVAILVVGAAIGAWSTYSFAQNLIMENLPIGTASLDEKDSYIKAAPDLNPLQPKQMKIPLNKGSNL